MKLKTVVAKTDAEIRDYIINAGVANLKEFGYSTATKANILTDTVYKAFFVSMLKSEENADSRPEVERVRRALLAEVS